MDNRRSCDTVISAAKVLLAVLPYANHPDSKVVHLAPAMEANYKKKLA